MSKTNQGIAENYWIVPEIVAEPLLFETPFLENESLTSWMVRASFNQYCTPLSFTHYYWLDTNLRIWSQDIDKGFQFTEPKIHEDIATLAECSQDEVTRHTLIDFAKSIDGNLHSTIALPWRTPLSKRSRYSRIGYPYCPDCMSDDEQAHLSLLWRLSWSVCCTKHKQFLQNQCSHCLYPYQPHLIPLEIGKINHCHHCQERIDTPINKQAPSNLILEYQNTVEKVYRKKEGLVFGMLVNAEVWFETLLFLINMTRRAFANVEYMFAKVLISLEVMKNSDDLIQLKSQLPFDCLSIEERVCLLEYAYKLIQIQSSDWKETLLEHNVTQNSFDWGRNSKIPNSFQSIYGDLPRVTKRQRKVKSQTSKPTSPKVVGNSWARLKRKFEMEQYYDGHKKESSSKSM